MAHLPTDPITNPTLLPVATGAYLLMIRLDVPAALPERFDGQHLPEGRYVYAGSAYGPGGIRARCRRHLRRDKARRWHVDWLASAASEFFVFAFPGGDECELVARLSKLADVRFPVPGFGSSDCRTCRSHLLQLPPHHAFDQLTLPQLSSGKSTV